MVTSGLSMSAPGMSDNSKSLEDGKSPVRWDSRLSPVVYLIST